jgi:nucleoid DNA-binding protein
MNKRQLVAAAARRTSLTQREMRQALEALLETIAEALASGEPVALSEFGRFEAQHYPGRQLRRFGGKGHYTVQGHPVPVFRSSEALRRSVREKKA